MLEQAAESPLDPCLITAQTFDSAAHIYQDKFMDISRYHNGLTLFCEKLSNEKTRLLELGCGPGNVTRYLLNKRPDFQILATDLAPNMLKLAQENCPEIETQILDCRQLDTLESQFDAIVAAFCLPYLDKNDVSALFKSMKTTLKPKGVIYLSTMEGDYRLSGKQTSSSGNSVYTYYHNGDELAEMLKQQSFSIIDLTRQDYLQTAPSTNASGADVIIIAQAA